MTINELMHVIHRDNFERGWWEGVDLPLDAASTERQLLVVSKLCLIHSEVSEALEELRKPGADLGKIYFEGSKPCGFATEIADAVIRLLDLAKACDLDLEHVIKRKLAYNRTRGHKHGGKTL